jgi:hypothetical protein
MADYVVLDIDIASVSFKGKVTPDWVSPSSALRNSRASAPVHGTYFVR